MYSRDELKEKEEDRQDSSGSWWDKQTARCAGIFTCVILAVFPLYFHNKYIDILTIRYQFYYISVLLLCAVTAALAAGKALDSEKHGNGQGYFTGPRRMLSLPNLFLLLFLLVILISTFGSDYLYESFWGNEGRYNGCFLWMIYTAAFLIVSGKLNFRPWYLDLFLITGAAVCLFGVADYLGYDPLGLERGLNPEIGVIYTSTIGNVNHYTAYVSLAAGAAAVCYGNAVGKYRTVCYGACLLTAFAALVTGQSDSVYLTIPALFGILPYFLKGRQYAGWRWMSALSGLLTVLLAVKLIETGLPDRYVRLEGLFLMLAKGSFLFYAVPVLWILSLLIYGAEKRRGTGVMTQIFLRFWTILLVVIVAAGIGILCDVNLAGHGQRYGRAACYLQFGDQWGNGRGYAWNHALEIYGEFPWMKKLFGYGPDTFGILMVEELRTEMMDRFGYVFNDVHNEYLQYLVTTGILGLISYLFLIGSSLFRILKKSAGSPSMGAIAAAVFCYHIQAVVNINVPIVAPVMWTLICVGLAGGRDTS